MSNVIFQFQTSEAAQSFFEWWRLKIQPKFLEDTKHDDYNYTITNHECASDEGFFDAHAVIIKEIPKVSIQRCTAKNCNEPAVGDYNGHGDYACEYHMRKWDKEFEDEYR
jgi:hypothetical protein